MTVTTNPVPAAQTTQDALHALLCEVLPPQGAWSDDAYLWLTDHSNRLIEFTDGYVQELPMPTFTHQAVLAFLYDLFRAYLKPRGGVVMFAALRVRIRAGKFREPDLLLLRDRADTRCQDRYWLGADLVAEVISPDNPDRDLVEKRADYAEAGIPEYWIVDPRDETIRVLTLQGAAYVEHGEYVRGNTATSPLLAGFAAEVSAVFDAPAARV
jgi:Uma2 family endonuclease